MTISKTRKGKNRPGFVWREERYSFGFARHVEIGWIFEGTEEVQPYAVSGNGLHGIREWGRVRVDGISTFKVANAHAKFLKPLGWTVVKVGTYYSYVIKEGIS